MATRWTPRIRAPLLFVRGADSYVELEVWGPNGIQEPTSGTLTVYDEDDTVIVNAQAISVDITTKRAYTTVLAASLPSTLEFSASWRAVWTMSLAGESASIHQDAQLIRRPWRATVTQGDLLAASPQLRNSYDPNNVEDNKALAEILYSVTEETQGRLVGAGSRPWLIFDPWRINSYVIQAALGRIFRSHLFDQDPGNFTALDKLATSHEDAAESAWAGMNFRYDKAETGKGGDQEQKQGPAVIRFGITR